MKRLRRLGLALAVAGLLSSPATAAHDGISTAGSVAHLTPVQAAAFSKQIEDDLASRGARVAMVFRTGRPRSKLPKGISYTHGAFWVYRTIATQDGRTLNGYAVYNLYAGDGKAWPSDVSRLVQDWPVNFTIGSAVDDVAVIVPSPEMQRRMLAVIDSPDYARLHNPSYSLISNPWVGKYQNCNDFMLDVIASGLWGTTDEAQLRADERAHFTPTLVQAGGLMRLFGPLVDKRIKTDDQSGPIRTVAYESMTDFMRQNGLLETSYILTRKP